MASRHDGIFSLCFERRVWTKKARCFNNVRAGRGEPFLASDRVAADPVRGIALRRVVKMPTSVRAASLNGYYTESVICYCVVWWSSRALLRVKLCRCGATAAVPSPDAHESAILSAN